MSMKKYCNYVKPIIFIILLDVFVYGAGIILEPKDNTKKNGIYEVRANGFYAEKKNSLDVLVIGDSESFTSISPLQMYEEHGFTGYALGGNAQKIYDSYYHLKRALENQKPKVVMLETNTLFRRYTIIDTINGEFNNLTPLFKYHDRWKRLSLRDFNLTKDYTYRDPSKGFYVRTKIEKASPRNYMAKSKNIYEMPSINAYYVEKIYELCKEQGIEFMLFSAPSLKNWYYAKHAGTQNVADELGIDFLDLNMISEIGIDWTVDTNDAGDHVNMTGAMKVTSYVGDYLAKKYNLVDRRNDPYYEEWDKDLEKYKEILASYGLKQNEVILEDEEV